MNRLTSFQRKMVYLLAIVMLAIPIVLLGRPESSDKQSAGKLAQLRAQYDLGESTFGNVDPSSATMNLMLLGLRGVAVNLLWLDAIQHKDRKNWAQLRSTVESITLLQPHYIRVWDFQGWNLAYNVSAEMDAVADRYYWVKEGALFLKQGTAKNSRYPEMYYWTGRIVGQKIGRADEWRQYRRYFRDEDPSPYIDGPDPKVNPAGKDNYLAAKDLFEDAFKQSKLHEQHVEAPFMFASKPYRSQLDYAVALQREGIFEERTANAWDVGYREWTEKYGKEPLPSPAGEIAMNATDEELEAKSKEDGFPVDMKKFYIQSSQNIINYTYWARRANAERRGEVEEAHRLLHNAEMVFFNEGNVDEAFSLVTRGMQLYEEVYDKYFQQLADDDVSKEEAIRAVLLWRYIHNLRGTEPPAEFPLNKIWDAHQDLIPSIESQLRRRQETGR